MKRKEAFLRWIVASVLVACNTAVARAVEQTSVEANRVAEIVLISIKQYENPFRDLALDAVVTAPGGDTSRVPMLWDGGNRWYLRYSSRAVGSHTLRTECSDQENAKLHGVEGTIEVVPYQGENPLYRHGPIRVAEDDRHFEHVDGTPFL